MHVYTHLRTAYVVVTLRTCGCTQEEFEYENQKSIPIYLDDGIGFFLLIPTHLVSRNIYTYVRTLYSHILMMIWLVLYI